MNIADDLMSFLAQWRTLTERETQGILNNDWKNVAEQQQRKAQLREAITQARELTGAGQTTRERTSGSEGDKLGAVVKELVGLQVPVTGS